MFEGWENFFLMVGGAAAVLIGLIYVVISLMHDRPRSSVLAGSRLYMGPIVLGVSFVLILSAAALTPGITSGWYAATAGVVALWGLARGIMSIAGLCGLVGKEREVSYRSFGFGVREVNGHDVDDLRSALASLPVLPGKPSALVCHTVKGKGIGFAENNMAWHHQNKVGQQDVDRLLAALEAR